MKNLFFPLLFALGPIATEAAPMPAAQPTQAVAEAAQGQDPQAPVSDKEAAKRARKARRQNGPDVYKGTLANQRRIIIDAENAQKDPEPKDEDNALEKNTVRPDKAKK